MPDSEEREKSEFNDALGYLRRINACLYSADMSSMALDAHGWFHALMGLYRELSTEIKTDRLSSFKTTILNLNDEINKLDSGRGRILLSAELYFKLNDFEIELRKIYDGAGLQMKRKEDRRFGL
jgi:hypothetical protein